MVAGQRHITTEQIQYPEDHARLKGVMRRGFDVVRFPRVSGPRTPFVHGCKLGSRHLPPPTVPPDDLEMFRHLMYSVNFVIGEKGRDLSGVRTSRD